MLLAIDIGNTDVAFGVFRDKTLIGTWRIASDLSKRPDEYGILVTHLLRMKEIPRAAIKRIIVSSVVPPLSPVFQQMATLYFAIDPMFVTSDLETGLTIHYTHPEEVGSDRIVNAVAAYKRYGGPVVIVDLGTATTFCVVTEKGEYLGGAIAPGLALSAETLFNHTAKLPKIALAKPMNIIGKNTSMSMQSGVFFGYIGLINEIVHRIHREIGSKSLVVATGGLAAWIGPECRTISKIFPTLTLEGLMIIYEKNQSVDTR